MCKHKLPGTLRKKKEQITHLCSVHVVLTGSFKCNWALHHYVAALRAEKNHRGDASIRLTCLPSSFAYRSLLIQCFAKSCALELLQTVTFNVAVLATEQAALRTTKGVTNELVAEALAGSEMLMPLIEVRACCLRVHRVPCLFCSGEARRNRGWLVWWKLIISSKLGHKGLASLLTPTTKVWRQSNAQV